MYDLIVRNLKFPDFQGDLKDIGIIDGRIAKIGNITDPTKREIDALGDLVLPPFVESHIHLDTVFTAGEPRWNHSGTLFEGIRIWKDRKATLTVEDVKTRAMKAIRSQLAYGILHERAHVDISDPDLTALYALLEVKEKVSSYMNLQIVAFPQEGIVSCPGNQERLEEALCLGVDAVGAIPHYEHTREDGIESLKICFSLAQKYDRMVNVFCDEIDDGQSKFLEVVANLALKTGLKGKVAASHANAMAYYSDAYVTRLFGLLQEADVNIISCPLISSAVQGRFDSFPKGRGIARIKELREAGINVSLGHDDIMTPFYPLGTGSMLQAVHMAIHLAHMTGRSEMEDALNMVTTYAAKTLNIESVYGFQPGNPANFITVPASDKFDLIRRQPICRYVFSKGNIVAETEPCVSHLNI